MAEAQFIDQSGPMDRGSAFWEPVLIPAEAIAAEVERLSALAEPGDGRRASVISHPRSVDGGRGLAPGIRCQLEVLLPGERTAPLRHNASEINFCIEGAGRALVGGDVVAFDQYDTWIHPSMAPYCFENPTRERQVRLTFSNEPLLEALHIHVVDEHPDDPHPQEGGVISSAPDDADGGASDDLIDLDVQGSALMSYERAINPPTVAQRVLRWPWREVRPHLERLEALGPEYRGRRLYLLYNRATGRTNGTSTTLFASLCLRPAGITDRPHRHSSAAINYFFEGHGKSVSGGETFHWKAGDLMLTAPGWVIHHNAAGDEPVFELTIQDQPLTLAIDALLWQEDLAEQIRLLGSHAGFATNRASIVGK